MNPVWKLQFFLFNIEGYGKFFSGITPKTDTTEVVTYTHKKVTVRRNCSDFFPGYMYVAFIKPVYPKWYTLLMKDL